MRVLKFFYLSPFFLPWPFLKCIIQFILISEFNQILLNYVLDSVNTAAMDSLNYEYDQIVFFIIMLFCTFIVIHVNVKNSCKVMSVNGSFCLSLLNN